MVKSKDVGKRVKMTGKWLKSVGLWSDRNRRGTLLSVGSLARVRWDDESATLEVFSGDPEFCDDARANGLAVAACNLQVTK